MKVLTLDDGVLEACPFCQHPIIAVNKTGGTTFFNCQNTENCGATVSFKSEKAKFSSYSQEADNPLQNWNDRRPAELRKCDDYVKEPKQRYERIKCHGCSEQTWSHYDFCEHCGKQMNGLVMNVGSAEWIEELPLIHSKCSRCSGQGFSYYNHCSWCGAKMKGARKHDTD